MNMQIYAENMTVYAYNMFVCSFVLILNGSEPKKRARVLMRIISDVEEWLQSSIVTGLNALPYKLLVGDGCTVSGAHSNGSAK